uniref:Uncharacterized protein n=1 Tax=Anopheles melas TaxID=34690 RepID=A0A182UH43_9DIPT
MELQAPGWGLFGPFQNPVAILLLPGGIDGEGGGTWNTVKAPPRGFAERHQPTRPRSRIGNALPYWTDLPTPSLGWRGGQGSIKFSFHPEASRHSLRHSKSERCGERKSGIRDSNIFPWLSLCSCSTVTW